jgi:hypothetical protein
MRRARSIAAVVGGALAWMAIAACNQQTIETPIRVFDRPSDVALACVQYDPSAAAGQSYTTRPLADCDPNHADANANNTPAAPGVTVGLGPSAVPFTPFVMAVVTQSARGELALVDTARAKLVDLDRQNPSFGFLPVGKLPEHVRASDDGCLAVTANVDSCDLSVVKLPDLINDSQSVAGDVTLDVHRLQPVVADGGKMRALQARPSWIEPAIYEPAVPADVTLCGGVEHRAWVALPGCQLVVRMRIDAPLDENGMPKESNVDAAVRVTQTGAEVITDPALLGALSCPAECAGGGADDGVDGGATASSGTQAFPGTIAVDHGDRADGGRLLIGDLHGERIDVIPLAADGKVGAPRSVQLEAGAGGVTTVRVSPRSPAGKFLYAIARDNSVRVVDLDREVECETNPDPRFDSADLNLQQTPLSTPPLPADPTPTARRLGCFPLGAPGTPPRAPLATSPGISLVPGQLPRDVAFIHVDQPPPPTVSNVAPPSASPGLLVGDFAWIVSSDGRGTVVDIFDACPQPNQQDIALPRGPFTPSCDLGNVALSEQQAGVHFGHPQPLLLDRVSHRIRPGTPRFTSGLSEADVIGAPRVTNNLQPCVTLVPSSTAGTAGENSAPPGRCDTGTLPGLLPEAIPAPLIMSVAGADTFPTRVIQFVNPDRARNETWSAQWEGTLPGTDRPLGHPQVLSDSSGTNRAYLTDQGGAWCGRGVLAGDKLILRGCTINEECDQAGKFQCVHDPGAPADVPQGMCLKVDGSKENTVESWSQRCGKLLRAQRKYRIVSAKQDAKIPELGGNATDNDYLQLAEIYEPEYDEQTIVGCTPPGANDPNPCAGILIPSSNPMSPPLATSCLQDLDGRFRCEVACTADDVANDTGKCGPDFECAHTQMPAADDYRCMRAPIGKPGGLWTTCMPELQNYEIHAGDAYLMSGSSSGVAANEAPGPDGECHPADVASAPPTTREAARLLQARVPLSGAPACPAGLTPLGSLDATTALSNICQFDDARFGSRVVHFENPIFNVSVTTPLSPADGRVIVPPDGTAVTMTLTGGSLPLSTALGIDVQAQQPRYVTVAPDRQTVYVVDEGKSISAAGLRGQLIRLYSPSQAVDTLFVVR